MTMSKDYITVGLTGQTGAGKTAVSEVFLKKGFLCVNADLTARKVQSANTPCFRDIVSCFGENIVGDNGEIDRRKLASIVFSDKDKLKQLEKICYPYISFDILKQFRTLSEKTNFILLDAPTLFESGTDCFCDVIVGVTADEETRLKRIMKRDNISEENALMRIRSQKSEDFFREHCDFIIQNNSDYDSLVNTVLETIEKIMSGVEKT